MLDNNLFDIILPFKNEELYIEKTILSILPQINFINKIIAVNDASTDSSESILKTHLLSTSKLVIINHQDSLGALKSIQIGLKLTEAKYISLLSANDYIHKNFYEKAFCDLNENSLGIWSAMVWDLTSDGSIDLSKIPAPSLVPKKISPQESYNLLLKSGPWFEGATLILLRQALLDNKFAFAPELGFFSDTLTCCSLANKYGCFFRPEPLAFNRVQTTSFNSVQKSSLKEYCKIIKFIEKNVIDFDLPLLLIERLKSRLLATFLITKAIKNSIYSSSTNTPLCLFFLAPIFSINKFIKILFIIFNNRKFDIIFNIYRRYFLFFLLKKRYKTCD